MRVLLIGQHYAPEDVSGAVLATELASDLVRRGHRVSFVTCAPNYPLGQVFPGYKNRLLEREFMDGVTVIRTWSLISKHKTFWRRIFNYGTFSATALHGGLLAGKPDVILSASPPLPLCMAAWILKRIWRVPWVLRVEDLYPESAVVAGVLRNRLAIRFFNAMERFFYREASHISLISEGFRRNLQNKGVLPEKLSVIPVWADPNEIRPLPKENSFRKAHGLENQFVIMYAGNLGQTSALEDILAAASLLQEEPDVQFVIVGQGIKKEALLVYAQEQGLDNVTFLPFQPREAYPQMMAAADVGLVTLNQDSSRTSMPSKTFSIMASERPVLAVTPPESEVAQLIQETQCGLNVPAGQPQRLAETILELRDDREYLQQMGRIGRETLIQNFSRNRCVNLYEKTLKAAISKNPNIIDQ
jgi:colanic acid biosynthesis glycosyl transferase WcaI